MAEEIHKNGGGNATRAVTLVLIVLLALGVWFFLMRGGQQTRDIDVDVNVPGQTGSGS